MGVFNKKEKHAPVKRGRETNLLLSRNVKISHDPKKLRLGCENVLVIGATGAGKSYMYIKPNLYSLPTDPKTGLAMSFVITDPKGELVHDSAAFLEKHGYDIRVLNLNEPRYSSCYNPFKYIKEDKDVLIMIDALIANANGKGQQKDKYWSDMASAMLCSIAFYLFYECSFSQQNFSMVSTLLEKCGDRNEDSRKPSTYENLLTKLEKESPKGAEHPAIKWFAKVKDARSNTYQSILSTAQAAVRLFASKDIQRLTYTDTLDLDRIGDSEKPVALFFTTSSTDSSYDFIVSMAYTQLFSTLLYRANNVYKDQGNSLPRHILFILDEFANIGQIPDFDKKIAVFRQANISCSIILQTPNQMESIYEKSADNIIGNTSIVLFLGNSGIGEINKTAADWMSNALGKQTIITETEKLNRTDSRGAMITFLDNKRIDYDFSKTGRELMTADEIRRLPGEKCIILIAGQYPILDYKITPNDSFNAAEAQSMSYDIHEHIKTSESYKLGIERGKIVDEKIRIQRMLDMIEDAEYQEEEIKSALEDANAKDVGVPANQIYSAKSKHSLEDMVKKAVKEDGIRVHNSLHEFETPKDLTAPPIEIINEWDNKAVVQSDEDDGYLEEENQMDSSNLSDADMDFDDTGEKLAEFVKYADVHPEEYDAMDEASCEDEAELTDIVEEEGTDEDTMEPLENEIVPEDMIEEFDLEDPDDDEDNVFC